MGGKGFGMISVGGGERGRSLSASREDFLVPEGVELFEVVVDINLLLVDGATGLGIGSELSRVAFS